MIKIRRLVSLVLLILSLMVVGCQKQDTGPPENPVPMPTEGPVEINDGGGEPPPAQVPD